MFCVEDEESQTDSKIGVVKRHVWGAPAALPLSPAQSTFKEYLEAF
jgi:hypothetical protein